MRLFVFIAKLSKNDIKLIPTCPRTMKLTKNLALGPNSIDKSHELFSNFRSVVCIVLDAWIYSSLDYVHIYTCFYYQNFVLRLKFSIHYNFAYKMATKAKIKEKKLKIPNMTLI